MRFLDTRHPAFRPLWVRMALVVVTAGWSVVEFVTGTPFWGVIFLGIAGFCVYQFFIDFDPDAGGTEGD